MLKITNEQVKISFTGHDTFPLRHGWLEKAYYAVEKNNINPFSTDDAIIDLCVGKNMVNVRQKGQLSFVASQISTQSVWKQ